MKIKDKFFIEKKETKTGTNSKGDWSIDEYTLLNELETEMGSIIKTRLVATLKQDVEALEIGADYNLTLFITSDEYGGKHYPKFRVTNAECLKQEEVISDDIPF